MAQKKGIGKCPKCGSEHLSYDGTELVCESLGYNFVCDDCKCRGIEWYNLTYSETTTK